MRFDVKKKLQLAIKYFERGDFKKSKFLLSQVIHHDPGQPDANYNMGILLKRMEDPERAVKYFKLALEANFGKAQYWFSLIDILCECKRFQEAIDLLALAKKKGCNGEAFEQLETRLNSPLVRLELRLAAYLELVESAPDYYKGYLGAAEAFHDMGKDATAEKLYKKVIYLKPGNTHARFNLGNIYYSQGNFENALGMYNEIVSINPDSCEVYINIALTLLEMGETSKAHFSLEKAMLLNPSIPRAYVTLGTILRKEKKFKNAIMAFTKAIALDENCQNSYNNLGVVYTDLGDYLKAAKNYKQALTIDGLFLEAFMNAERNAVQLSPVCDNLGITISTPEGLKPLLEKNCEYQILQALRNFVLGDFAKAKTALNQYRILETNGNVDLLSKKNRDFCVGYADFIEILIAKRKIEEHNTAKKIYHLGESHCLSFARSLLNINGHKSIIHPQLTFGVKAYHLAQKKNNFYKSSIEYKFKEMPKFSTVLISIGEIDCRLGEGFLKVKDLNNAALRENIEKTVKGYVSWIKDQNKHRLHNLYFLNIPAPVYRDSFSQLDNEKAAKVVKLFNERLQHEVILSGFNLIDVYKLTIDRCGFSNNIYHIDAVHLGRHILPEISIICDLL